MFLSFQFVLNIFKLVFQEVHEVVVLVGVRGAELVLSGFSLARDAHHSWLACLSFKPLGLQLLDLLLLLLDDLLAEMASLGKLLLDFLVDLDVSLVGLNLFLLFVVAEEEVLSLLGLVLKLGGKLLVLEDGQGGGSLKLLVIEGKQVSLSLLDLIEHLLP